MARHKSGKFRTASEHCSCYREGDLEDGVLWCATHSGYVMDCVVCGDWFHSHRPHTLYCSSSCSQRAYRARKKESMGCAT